MKLYSFHFLQDKLISTLLRASKLEPSCSARFVETSCQNSQFSRDVTAAMLEYRTIAKKVFWEFYSIIVQNLSDILSLFCTPTWPSNHVSENQEFLKSLKYYIAFVFDDSGILGKTRVRLTAYNFLDF